MQIPNVREFRASLKSAFDRAASGEIVLVERDSRIYRLALHNVEKNIAEANASKSGDDTARGAVPNSALVVPSDNDLEPEAPVRHLTTCPNGHISHRGDRKCMTKGCKYAAS